MSVRECTIYAVEGQNFHGPQLDAAWLFLIGVYSAHRSSSRSFSSLRPNGRDFPAGWTFEIFTLHLWGPVGPSLPDRLGAPAHSFLVSLYRVQLPSLCTVQISLNFAIFCILQGQLLSSSDGCFGFITFHARWYFIELCNILLQSQLLPPRRKCSSLAWESGLLTNRLAETAFQVGIYYNN